MQELGSLEDAKALRDSFRQPKPTNRRGRGKSAKNGDTTRKGSGTNSPSQKGQRSNSGAVPNGAQPTSRSAMRPYPNSTTKGRARSPRPGSGGAGRKRMKPSEQGSKSPNYNRGNSMMESTHTGRQEFGVTTTSSSKAQTQIPSQPTASNYFSPAQVPSLSSKSTAFASQEEENDDLMDFELSPQTESFGTLIAQHTQQRNSTFQPSLPSTTSNESSILDIEGKQTIYQPVLQPISRSRTRQVSQDDVTMSDAGSIISNAVPKRKGLSASRWNTNRPKSPESLGDPMAIDPPSAEKRGHSRVHRSPGRIVTNGFATGPGLADSRWAH
ncbi:uncharacterized protein GGS25DRAFT_529432 [Hypoxylon fragiforme]|uniref:uncharacterized protein n=1 Tax=Hypoxylon fragiforme TaxID=63214 RepID=UPI0020C5C30B|nr:uncharacterized protein GGS25DRAFT_529432 [Hypoxylon fragiforme]KAI2612909.1 hypothetical protein GGS25DRAFT_529432 [Hypoxylon fragiforme]